MSNANIEATEAPPPFKPGDAIQLSAVDDSKITGVSVYTGRAEITRLFKFKVQTGQNQVNINGLPNGLDHDSLRLVFAQSHNCEECHLDMFHSHSELKAEVLRPFMMLQSQLYPVRLLQRLLQPSKHCCRRKIE
jgi:hypothetical protein